MHIDRNPDDDLAKFDDLIPSGTPLAGFRIVMYLDEDGDKAYSWGATGQPGTDTILTMLAVAGYQVGAHAQRQYLNALDDEDDD